jgi:hypothetical protein
MHKLGLVLLVSLALGPSWCVGSPHEKQMPEAYNRLVSTAKSARTVSLTSLGCAVGRAHMPRGTGSSAVHHVGCRSRVQSAGLIPVTLLESCCTHTQLMQRAA